MKKPTKNLILTIDERYSIEDDGKQYILYETKISAKGEPNKHFIGSFQSLDYLLHRLARLKVGSKHQRLTMDKYLVELKLELEQLRKAVSGWKS